MGFAQGFHVFFQRADIGYGGKEGIIRHMFPAFKGNRQFTDLGHARTKFHAEFFFQPFFRHRTRSHHRSRQTGTGTTTAARITPTILLVVGEIGMTGAEGVQDIAIVFATLIGVFNQQSDRRSRGFTFVHPAQNPNCVRLIALGDEFRCTRAAAIQVPLNIRLAQVHPGGAAIHHATNGCAVGFAEIGNGKECSECISAHNTITRLQLGGFAAVGAIFWPVVDIGFEHFVFKVLAIHHRTRHIVEADNAHQSACVHHRHIAGVAI